MVVAIPTGLVTFLFTDVEGSTRLWEEDAVAMAASLAHHDRIMQASIAAHNGYIFSTAGDAFAAAFAAPADALGAAVAIQVQFHISEWPGPAMAVRMGIHTGSTAERDGDFFGPVVNRAARIMSAGNGGQIIVSSVTAELAPLGNGASLVDLGTHHLKDLETPEHLFEIRHPDLPTITDPINSVDIRRHNLPDYLTSFVGRSALLKKVADTLSDHRLVTLTGVGGTGKTRVAVEAARAATSTLPDGAWIVELAPVTNPAFIMTAIGDTWGLRPGEGASIEDVVNRYLWSRGLLLVVDNCEHLLSAATAAIETLLNACPDLRIIATSRESLGVAGETVLGVPSLGLSDGSTPIEKSEAALLFLDRARAVRPDFDPDEAELADIQRICTRIDAIPLGLELAAARLRSISTHELVERLEHSFRILSGSAKSSLPRQRTLHATIQWSYDLLNPGEQRLFRRLSVFTGGFDIAAAETVCPDEQSEPGSFIDDLDSLVDKSLVVSAHHRGESTRYRLLEPMRQYAQEVLRDSAESEQYRSAHATYFAELVAKASPCLRGPDQMQWLTILSTDYDNVRTALGTFLESQEIETHLRMVFDLFNYWMHKGMQLEGIDIGLAGLASTGPETDADRIVKAWWTTALMSAEVTLPAGVSYARKGLEIAIRGGNLNNVGKMELVLGSCIRHTSTDPGYVEHLEEGRRLLKAHPEPAWWDPTWERGYIELLLAAYLPADDKHLRDHMNAALEIFETFGDRVLLAATLADSAGIYFLGEDDESQWALHNARRACDIFAEVDSSSWHGHALLTLGMILVSEGEHLEARETLATAAHLFEQIGDVNCWANSTRYVAKSEVAMGDTASAAAFITAVIERIPSLPMPEVGKPRTLDIAAEVLLASGRTEEGGLLVGTALAHPVPASVIRPPELEKIRQTAVELIGDDEAARLFQTGGNLDIDDALDRALGWLNPE